MSQEESASREIVEFASIEQAVLSVAPDARFGKSVNVYQAWPSGFGFGPVPRSLAEAQKIAAAVIDRYGGHVETRYFSEPLTSSAAGCVQCVLPSDVEVVIFFDELESCE